MAATIRCERCHEPVSAHPTVIDLTGARQSICPTSLLQVEPDDLPLNPVDEQDESQTSLE